MTWKSIFDMNLHLIIISLICFSIFNLNLQGQNQKIDGLTVVAPPNEFKTDPFPRIKMTNADWVSFVPYGFCRQGSTDIWYDVERQWWGEKPEGVIKCIQLARNNGLKIFLKPQIYVPGSWTGSIDFETEEEWKAWEKGYTEFILSFAKIAAEYDVELFCIGTEFKVSAQKRPKFWLNLIKEIREIYCGELTYSANWDAYVNPQFWSSLDYVGISAYFPLVNKTNPSVKEIRSSWKPIVKKLKKFSDKINKPILFTEYGYLSVDGTTYRNWELEKKINSLRVNEQAQANALQALYESLWGQKFWSGGFLWKWFPNDKGHEGYIEKDYTVKDKLAENILKQWFN